LILVGVLLAGCGSVPAQVPPKAVQVKAVKVIQQDMAKVHEYAGQIQGKNDVKIQARVSGNIVEKMVSGGDMVKAGQPLFRIDSIQYESTLLSAQAQLVQAEANWENSRLDTERYQSLLNAAAIAEQRLTTQKATERQNEAIVASYRALVKKAQDDFNSTLVVSPIDGRIDVNDVGIGTYVQAGTTTLVTVGAQDPVFVQFSMGKVTQADRSLANNSGTLTLKASVSNPDGILIPGMFARVKIAGVPVKNAMLVPQRAVQQVLDKALVMVVGEGSKAEPRPVILGDKVGSYYLVKEGLTVNDTIVVEGLTKAQEGMALDVTIVTPAELELSVNS